MKGPFRSGTEGTSLLEVMISLMLMAMIFAILNSGLNLLRSRMEASPGQSEMTDVALARMELLGWVENAVGFLDVTRNLAGLEGHASGFSFQAAPMEGQSWGGKTVVISLQTDEKGRVSFSISRPMTSEGKDIPEDRALSQVGAILEVYYFGSVDGLSAPEWARTWGRAGPLPMLIAVMVKDEANDYPPLVLVPGLALSHSEMSLSSLLPPGLPSRP